MGHYYSIKEEIFAFKGCNGLSWEFWTSETQVGPNRKDVVKQFISRKI
jgi:hypothetical protein